MDGIDLHLAAIPPPWVVETAPGPTGRPYHRATHPRGWQRGAYDPATLAELVAETPAGWPRGTREQLELWTERSAA